MPGPPRGHLFVLVDSTTSAGTDFGRLARDNGLEPIGSGAASGPMPADLTAVRELAGRIQLELTASTGRSCRLIVGTGRSIADARAEAEVARATLRALGGRSGAYLHGDVLLEHLLLADRRILRRVSAVLDPLTHDHRHRVLVDTLEAFVSRGFSQAATARFLRLHRHTVLYRVSRAERLLGRPIKPGRDGLLVALALVASKLERQVPRAR